MTKENYKELQKNKYNPPVTIWNSLVFTPPTEKELRETKSWVAITIKWDW